MPWAWAATSPRGSYAEHYSSERLREQSEVREKPHAEAAEVGGILQSYGLTAEQAAPIVEALKTRPEAYVDFMMRFELGLEQPEPGRAVKSAATIALSYIAGGLVPLIPYWLFRPALALEVSAAVTLSALAVFGAVKARFNGVQPLRSAVQTVVIGGLAAGAAFGLAKAIS